MKFLLRVCNERDYEDKPSMCDVPCETLEFGEGYEPVDFLRDNVFDLIDLETIDEETFRVAYLEHGCEMAQYFKFTMVA